MIRSVFTYLLLVAALFNAATAQAEEMQLSVKPILCITDSRNPSCDMSFLVAWESETEGYYCLFNNLTEAPLRCWNQARTGDVTDERVVSENFSFWMTDDDYVIRLAQVDVEVLRMDSDDRRRRRRTRHVWDIN